MASTIKINDTIEWAKRLSFNRALALGNSLEPALTAANTVMQVMTGPPFSWRWNRNAFSFVLQTGVQDYIHAPAWAGTTAITEGTMILDSNGNGEVALTTGTTGNVQPTWPNGAGSLFQTVTDGGVTWQQVGPIGSTPALADLFWMEKASVQDINQNPAKWFEMQPMNSL